MLKTAKQFLPQDTLITMYNALVLPHFDYCFAVWHDGNNSNIDKLFKLQKRAARIITGSTYEIRSVEIFNNLKWSPVINTLNQRESIMMYKILKRFSTNLFDTIVQHM